MPVRAFAFLSVLVSISGACAWAQTPAAPDEERPVFRVLERVALDASASKTDRLSAIGSMAKAAHPSLTPTLLVLLGDPDPALRSAGALALGWAGNQVAIDSLVQHAEDAGEDAPVRISAVRSLGRIGDPAAVPAVERLARDPGVQMRREALLVLTESALSAHADRVSAAIAFVEDTDQDGHVRSRAAVLLAGATDPRAVEPLIRVLKDPRPPAGFSSLPSPDGLTGQARIMAERLRSLHDVRAHAAMALGQLSDPRATPALLASLSDADPLVRTQSAAALGRLKARDAAAGLIDMLDDSDARVREVAARALGTLCDPTAGPALRAAIHDQEGEVRARAATALGRLGYEAARPDLVKLAEEDPAPRVREGARAALHRLDSASPCQ